MIKPSISSLQNNAKRVARVSGSPSSGGSSQSRQAVRMSEGALPLGVDVELGLMRDSVSFQLRQASWAVHSAFATQFAPADAVPRQYSVLYLISINSGVSVKALAAAIGVDQSTLVPTLNVCEERGWIRRKRGKPDRRLVALDLTAKGHQILEDLQRMLKAHEASVTSKLTAEERRHLLLLLRKVRLGTLS